MGGLKNVKVVVTFIKITINVRRLLAVSYKVLIKYVDVHPSKVSSLISKGAESLKSSVAAATGATVAILQHPTKQNSATGNFQVELTLVLSYNAPLTEPGLKAEEKVIQYVFANVTGAKRNYTVVKLKKVRRRRRLLMEYYKAFIVSGGLSADQAKSVQGFAYATRDAIIKTKGRKSVAVLVYSTPKIVLVVQVSSATTSATTTSATTSATKKSSPSSPKTSATTKPSPSSPKTSATTKPSPSSPK